ncbi:Ral guanine nucleotide dissociation stimulator-like [Trichinella spiralis]|uniref:Ral guanine nucleotide dissociation stimulator-like n=1 Tax=Trichinella spiralis TaxID=6334 RepID=A0ABR3KIC1_TRISP
MQDKQDSGNGYASGYASGKLFVICENFRDFQKDCRGLRPRLRFRQNLKNIYPQAMP